MEKNKKAPCESTFFYDEAVKPVLQMQKKCFFGFKPLQKHSSRALFSGERVKRV